MSVPLRLPEVRARPAPRATGRRCELPWRSAYISYTGEAMPCCMISTPDRLNFGRMDRQGVAATWNSETFETFRRQLDSETPPEICRSCAVYRSTF